MTFTEALSQLESLGNETMRRHNKKFGSGDNQFGVKHGDIRRLAKKIKSDQSLGTALWETGNVDAQLLACLIMTPKTISADEMESLVSTTSFAHVADWFNANLVKEYPEKEKLRVKWLKSNNRWACGLPGV